MAKGKQKWISTQKKGSRVIDVGDELPVILCSASGMSSGWLRVSGETGKKMVFEKDLRKTEKPSLTIDTPYCIIKSRRAVAKDAKETNPYGIVCASMDKKGHAKKESPYRVRTTGNVTTIESVFSSDGQ